MIEKMKNLISKVNNDFDHIFSCLDDNVSSSYVYPKRVKRASLK